jgi:hypothetical protein
MTDYELAHRRAQEHSRWLLAMQSPWTYVLLGGLTFGVAYVVWRGR